MAPKKIKFELSTQRNSYRKSGQEWALSVVFVGRHSGWTIKTWGSKPSEKTVQDIKLLCMRCFKIYHRALRIPEFNVEEVE